MHLSMRAALSALTLTMFGGAAGAATMASDVTALTLAEGGTRLVTLMPATGAVTSVAITAGGATLGIDDIDLRPATGELYGFDHDTATVYLIDRGTGAATAVATGTGLTSTSRAGFDFNNMLDAARVVTTAGENVVFFPNNTPPNLSRFTDLSYAAGDGNEGAVPQIRMNAYTNAVAGATQTRQFVIDTDLGVLATLANNAGTLATVGMLTFDGMAADLSDMGGFDIFSVAEGDNTAFALLTLGGVQAIYAMPLFADADGRVELSLFAAAPREFGPLDGFAIAGAPAPAPVPVPAAFGLAALGLGALAMLRRTRTA